MIRKVFGMKLDVKNVISCKSEKCDFCQHETPTCQKLYVRAGSNRTVCVELG